MKLTIVPCDIREANSFIERYHRHHRPAQGAKFALGVADEFGNVCGAALVGRPVARRMDDGFTLEVTRVATNGTKNACSALYAAAWRTAREMGYRKVITYTLAEVESGTSLKAAGWKCLGERGGGSWSVPSRPRVDMHPTQTKIGWEIA